MDFHIHHVFFVLLFLTPVASADTVVLEPRPMPYFEDFESRDPFEQLLQRAHDPQEQVFTGDSGYKAAGFDDLVRKEPGSYGSDRPLRGVIRLGDQDYAYVLDTEDRRNKGYHRLHFDLNGNGDLTDDGLIEARPAVKDGGRFYKIFSHRVFPSTPIALIADGRRVEYEFIFTAAGLKTQEEVHVAVVPGFYREGEITVNGEALRVALFDSNCNGRFDDSCILEKGRVTGDFLHFNPKDLAGTVEDAGIHSWEGRHPLSPVVNILDHAYSMKASPCGSELEVEPLQESIGFVANPNDRYSVLLHGAKGTIKVRGGSEKHGPVPEGEWRIVDYLINKTDPKYLKSRRNKQPAFVAKILDSLIPLTYVHAEFNDDSPVVNVRAGKTSFLSFGPPFRGVAVVSDQRKRYVSFDYEMRGTAGELVREIKVGGRCPPEPLIAITDENGRVVNKGKFNVG